MASNTIKGLTISIGADTTKLGKAIKDVEAQSKKLGRELGDINKLLKLDPSNTELLSQKQKVLTDTIAATAQKLETLKEAERQVQEQFERGEVTEEQVRALQREIVVTINKMEEYENAAKETAEAMEKAAASADSLAKESKDMGNSAGDAAGNLDKTAVTADDLAGEVENVEKASDGAAESLTKMAASTEKAEKSSNNMGNTMKNVAKTGLKAVAAAVTAVIGALTASSESTRQYRADMGKLETAFKTAGLGAEAAANTYKQLQGILGESDQAVEAANHLSKLASNQESLSKWTNIAAGVYATFGASLPIENLTEASNETAKTGAIVGGLADALNWAGESETGFQLALDACTSEQERQVLITETLNRLYSDAAAVYRETNAEVIRANEANEEWNATVAEMGESFEPLLTDVKLLGVSMLEDLLPGVLNLNEAFGGMLNGDDAAASEVGEALSGIVTDTLEKIVNALPAVVDVALGLVTELLSTILGMLPDVVGVVSDIVKTLVDGIVEALPTLVSAITDALPDIIAAVLNLANDIVGLLPDLVDDIVNMLPTFLEDIAMTMAEVIPLLMTGIKDILLSISDVYPAVINSLTEVLPEIGAVFAEVFPQFVDAITAVLPEIVTTLIDRLVEFYPQVIESVFNLFMAIVEVLPEIGTALLSAVEIAFNNVFSEVLIWRENMMQEAVEIAKGFVDSVAIWLQDLPHNIGLLLGAAIGTVASWSISMRQKAIETGAEFLKNVIEFFRNLPENARTWLESTLTKIKDWAPKAIKAGKEAAKDLVESIMEKIEELPDKLYSAGEDLVRGLINGIQDMASWVRERITSFASGVLDGFNATFEINSPSKRTEWSGEMLDKGLAQGITKNMQDPISAMEQAAAGILNASAVDPIAISMSSGTFTGANISSSMQENAFNFGGIGEKLDMILRAIERGQVLMIDGDQLIGATAAGMNAKLGQIRLATAKGAIT